jgi:hypothetical protein
MPEPDKVCVENSDGVGPSYEELSEGLAHQAKVTYTAWCIALEAKGWINGCTTRRGQSKLCSTTSTAAADVQSLRDMRYEQ